MARIRAPERDEAKEIYIEHKGNITNREIANIINEDEKKIAVWKKRDNWDNEESVVQQKKDNKKSVVQQTKSNNKKSTSKEKKEPISEVIKEVMENEELNDKHRQFCVIYAKRQNATKAYQMVYHCTYETAMVKGSLLVRNVKIREQIDKLLEVELNKEYLKKGLIQQYKDIAFSDIGDYVEFGKKLVPQWNKDKDGNFTPIIDPNTGEQKVKEYSYVDLKDSIGLDTSLISEVSEGKDGIKFKLADKMKAMDMLAKLSNLLNDEERTKLELEYKNLQNEKTKAEIDKLKGDNIEVEDTDELEGEIYGNS